jgi:hypothetical protein
LSGKQLESLGVATLGVHLKQLGADRHALRAAAHGFLEDLFCLQVASVSEVNVGLGHRIDVADGIKLTQRVAHRRRRSRSGLAGVDALTAAGAEERVRLEAAFEE